MKILSILLLASALWSHDLYLRPREFRVKPKACGVVEFHNGEAFPRSQVPPVVTRLRGATVLSAVGKSDVSGIRVVGTAAAGSYRAPGSAALLIVAYTIPNFIELAAAKFDEYLVHEHLNAVRDQRFKMGDSEKPGRELYSKFVKAILHTGGPDQFVTRPVGHTIEFGPASDPASLKPGEKLTVQLLFRGAPAADLAVEAASATGGQVQERLVGRTDAAGKIQIPIDTPGLWKLHAIRMERRTDTAKADWESYWATLTFEILAP